MIAGEKKGEIKVLKDVCCVVFFVIFVVPNIIYCDWIFRPEERCRFQKDFWI